ncbi:PepSY domain-containing protein [Streptomyces lunaelactis]|uniref:PepSY-associated TM helix domain-containing protein n=1 Tax=Streptomyces lunaelactis TaxID=1535768 RepID=UPI001584B4C5|nr:PepSY domain-containing protein [Streptomyces lunaelactis]NUK06107.1 PepSY domain-containing protein [Streptomyces lunaelactis]NUK20699.1 PepSY domain-containing protein [Streptomyces lunaelactis]NUK34760.1 PepSY domain-containing protein [Streptomyces lunaelactis]NUK45442.1 PepSY domain-containing protein [Streptomyces lunaelactis]NUK96911.1 PepSY domain-containing protein [Streptomyces lunaelactis]
MAIDDAPSQSTESTQSPERADETRSGSTWSSLRPLVLRLHFYAGLLIAPLLLIAATSGLLYALSFQAEKVIYSHELEVPVGDRTLPLGAQVEAARKARPDGTVTAVWPSSEDGATTRVLMTTPEVEEGKSLAVFVDPYTAEIRGELPSYGSSGALPLRTWLDGLHRDLHLGDLGRNYSEMAASWLWVVALGGLALWLGRRRGTKRALVVPERGPKGRRRTLSWHGSVGLWAVTGLVMLSVTGLTWSRYAGENIGAVQDQLGGATPTVSAALEAGSGTGDGHEGHAGTGGGAHQGADVGIDKAVESARAAGIDTKIGVTLPAEGSGYVIKERDAQFPVHLDSAAVDPSNGKVIDELRFADYPLLAKLTRFGIDAHMGVFLGLVNQLALAALTFALILLILWGYRMWWLRRPTKERKLSAGRPMPRGAWRKVPLPALLPLAAVTALAGWFVPMLGISLLVFLAVDLTLGAVARIRARAA